MQELKEFFADRDRFKRLASPLSDETSRHDDLPATVRYFGDYELLEEVAAGGMGVVYKARQTSLNRIVALKMIRAGHLASDEDLQRFKEEARTAANLKHKAIVPIYEVGQQGGQHYFSMQYIEGQNLADRIRTDPPSPEMAARIIKTIASAIDYAHQQGTVHRDLKPSNILVDEFEQVHVTDFGLAMRVEGNSDLTRTGQIMGTACYMPPEQARGHRKLIGPRSDIYSLGAVLYEMLTGRPPFRDESTAATLTQLLESEPLPPSRLDRKVPADLETICLKCLEKEPDKRYTEASLLADDLGRFLIGAPILARPVGRVERVWRWSKRNPVVASLSAATLLLLVTIAAVTTFGYIREADLRQDANRARDDSEESLARWKDEQNVSKGLRPDIGNLKQTRNKLDKRVQATQAILDKGEQKQFATFLQLARRAWEADDVELADYYLNQCPERFRDEVWQRLKRECYPPVVKFEGKQCIAISPDGTLVAAASAGGRVKVWEIETGRELHKFDDIAGGVDAIRFSPDGNMLAGCGDLQVVLWDLRSGQHLHTFKGHSRRVTDIDFSPDGTRLASASFGREDRDHHGSVIVWNLETFQQERTFPSTRYAVFSHDGRYLATANKVWDLSQPPDAPQAEVVNLRRTNRRPAFHPKQNVLAIVRNTWPEVIELRRVPSNEVEQSLSVLPGWSTSCLAFTHDVKRLALGRRRYSDYSTAPRTFRTVIWNLMTQETERILPWHLNAVTDVEFRPGKPMLATAEKDVIKLWDITAPHNPTQVILDDIVELQVGRYDWPQWGGSRARVNTPFGKNIPADWDCGRLDRNTGEWTGSRNIKWVAKLGSQTYGNPVVANGRIFLGTNNAAGYVKRYPSQVDIGVLLCLEESTGQFLWQHSNEKLPTGRVHDWPLQGVCSTPMVDGNRLWYVSNCGEVVCLDTEGYYDGEDDGPEKGVSQRLFSLSSKLHGHLRYHPMTPQFRKAFADAGITLPPQTRCRKDPLNRLRWKLGSYEDPNSGQTWKPTYEIRLDGDQLRVFELDGNDPPRATMQLLTLDDQLFPSLDQGELDEDLRTLFLEKGVKLPERIDLTTEEAGLSWSFNAEIAGAERKFRLLIEGPVLLTAHEYLEPIGKHEADVVWKFDMMKELGVSQHNMANCSVLTADGMLFVCTSNGCDESHLNIPAPEAPSFIALDRDTGKVIWTDNSPGKNILHAQWASPSYGVFDGQPQVIFPGGDGWVYSFDPKGDGKGGSRLLWKFDGNPKESKWILGGRGTRNNIIAFPAIYDGLVYVVMGQDPEHGEGQGHLWCIDPAKHTDGSDVSAELALDRDGDVMPHRRLQAVYPWSSGFKGGPELAEGLEEGRVSKGLRKRIESLGVRLSEAPKVTKQQRDRARQRRAGWVITSEADSSASFLVIVHVNKDGERTGMTVEKATGERAALNPKSAVVWHYSQQDRNGDGKFSFEETFHRSLSIPAIKDKILYIPDFSGLFHCLNAKTGDVYWTYDLFAQCWGSALLVDDKVYLGDEDGDVANTVRHDIC